MKKLLFLGMMATAAFSARSQELLFKVSQAGTAYRNPISGKFTSAEVDNIDATIFLQKDKAVVLANTKAIYTLTAKEAASKINNSVIVYSYNGRDEKNAAISFICTLHLTSKQAVVEVANDKLKNYYFGTYSSSDLSATSNSNFVK